MTRQEFEVLRAYAEGLEIDRNDSGISDIEKKLLSEGYIDSDGITETGLAVLEPFRVKRAVFLAAGFGNRMKPITINTPKPLVRVHGKRIIETLLDAILELGIEEIYIVCGYLAEEFEILKKKYSQIVLLNNPDYMKAGTIASFYYAREFLSNAYVFESDLVLLENKSLHKYLFSSGFMGTRVYSTDDWYLKTDEEGIITEVGIGGSGDNCYKLFGVSYWDELDGVELSKDLRNTYESQEGYKLPMSHVPFRVYKDKYRVRIMECGENDFIEIDTFNELQEYDHNYALETKI